MKAKDLAAKLMENPDSDVLVYPPDIHGIVYDIVGLAALPNRLVLISRNNKPISNEEERIVGICCISIK